MSAGIELDLDLSARIAGGVGQAVADALAADRRSPRPKYSPGVIFPDTAAVVLSGGVPQPNWVGPMLGWAWRIFRLQINGALGTTQPQSPSQPAVPASGVAVQNTNPYTVQVVLAGFTATQVFVNGIQVGTGNGTYVVPPAGAISVTYTVAGTWTWSGASGTATQTGSYIIYRDSGQGVQDQLLPVGVAQFTPNGVYEPHDLYLRYPKKINAVGTFSTGGLLVVDFVNIREDYLADVLA